MTKAKYGNIDELLSGAGNPAAGEGEVKRTRRPSPALGIMTGDKRPTTVTDSLKEEKRQVEQKLSEIKKQFSEEKASLLRALEDAKAEAGEGVPIILTMPVSKQEIRFELCRLNPSLIDVSEENERIQEFLDEISLRDILPSIQKHGQQKPGTVRRKPNGRYELIEGSRRLAAVKLAGLDYLALVGDVPDADVREVAQIENKHLDVSPYEKAKAYERQIARGEYENWTQLGIAKGISSSHISRYRACAELDEIFVKILASPSDMSLSYAETIAKLRKKSPDTLNGKAKALLETRDAALVSGGDLLEADDILRALKNAVRSNAPQPKSWKPVVYGSKGGLQLKHSVTNRGATKFEIVGADDSQLEKILEIIKTTFRLNN